MPPSNIHGCSVHTFLHQKTSIHTSTSEHIIVIHISTSVHPTTLLIHSYISTHHSYTHQYTPVQKYILYQYISIHYSYTIYTPVQQYILQHPTLYHTAPWSCTIYHSAHCLHIIGKPFLGLWPKLWGVGVKSPNFCFLSTSTAIHNFLVKIQIQLHILMFMWHIWPNRL